MFIQIQTTPNPKTLKFVLDESILQNNETYSFENKEDAKISPLALEIFNEPLVKSVFIGNDFISVTIDDDRLWDTYQQSIISIITHYVSMGKIIVEDYQEEEKKAIIGKDEKEQEVIDKIEELFEERIRPAVAMDGGDIIFKDYQDGRVYIKMYGACQGCPSAGFTLKNGIENMLKYYVEEVQEVISIE